MGTSLLPVLSGLANYCPGSDLPFLSKADGEMAINGLQCHLPVSWIPPVQFQGRAWDRTALVALVNDLFLSIDDGSMSILMPQGLSVVFNAVDLVPLPQDVGVNNTRNTGNSSAPFSQT